MRPLAASLSLMLALALPPAALAEDSDVGPRLTCVPRALRIGAAEMSGLRLQCSISGAPGEQSFTISLDQTMADVAEAGAPPLGRETVCSGMLTDGTGACVGVVFNGDSPAFGFAHISAELMPSGVQLADAALAAPPALPTSQPVLTFEPLPEPTD